MAADRLPAPAIVVTGAASGIGCEIARVAAGEGVFLMLVDRAQSTLDKLLGELAAAGCRAGGLCIDLCDRHAGERIEAALSERGFFCDVLVNSAGIAAFGAAADTERAHQLDVLGVNAMALTELTLRFLPAMVARGSGGVINVGSITGYAPGPNMAVYYASKAYVRSFSAALAAEVADSGVTVTCLCPGVVRTPLLENSPASRTRLYKLMPRTSARKAAEAGWHGFRAGKRVVIPRLTDRFIAWLAALLPHGLSARIVAVLQRSPTLQ